ncbi:MAG: hypothetical protein FWG32_07595 [Oscillospiraceae bacterium]|nr:hypothetical protein [Oscillospiraceae bacterium]
MVKITVIEDFEDIVDEANHLRSLAEVLHIALAEGHTAAEIYEGAAFILWEHLYDFVYKLKEADALSEKREAAT